MVACQISQKTRHTFLLLRILFTIRIVRGDWNRKIVGFHDSDQDSDCNDRKKLGKTKANNINNDLAYCLMVKENNKQILPKHLKEKKKYF